MRCVLSTFILPDKALKKFINLTPAQREKCQVPYVEPKKVLRSKKVTDETSTDTNVTRQKRKVTDSETQQRLDAVLAKKTKVSQKKGDALKVIYIYIFNAYVNVYIYV